MKNVGTCAVKDKVALIVVPLLVTVALELGVV
jgi:hypothetical protein